MTPYKNRILDPKQPVQVYRNLHSGKGYSVRQNRLVVAHAEDITLLNAEFVIRYAGRERTQKCRVRGVHAWVNGMISSTKDQGLPDDRSWYKVVYSPFDDFGFHLDSCSTSEVYSALLVSLSKNGCWVWRPSGP